MLALLDRNAQLQPDPSSTPTHIKIEANRQAEEESASQVPGMAGEATRRRAILPVLKQEVP